MDAAASVHSAAHAPLVTAVTVVPTHISTLQSGDLEAPLLSIDVPGLLEQPLGVSEHMLPEVASDEKKKVRLCLPKAIYVDMHSALCSEYPFTLSRRGRRRRWWSKLLMRQVRTVQNPKTPQTLASDTEVCGVWG